MRISGQCLTQIWQCGAEGVMGALGWVSTQVHK